VRPASLNFSGPPLLPFETQDPSTAPISTTRGVQEASRNFRIARQVLAGRCERSSAQSTRLKQEDEPSLCLDADTVRFVP
jgi:hypothetical protein